MSTTKSTSHGTLKNRDTSVMKGIDKHLTTNFTIAGTTYTPAELKALFQSEITAIEASDALRKSLTDSVQNVKTVGATVKEAYLLLRGGLITLYGRKANAVLNDFGMQIPKASGPQTVEAKALAKAKSAATRVARHTLGSAQKKAVTGNVVGITTTPVVAGAPVASAAPVTPERPSTPTPSARTAAEV